LASFHFYIQRTKKFTTTMRAFVVVLALVCIAFAGRRDFKEDFITTEVSVTTPALAPKDNHHAVQPDLSAVTLPKKNSDDIDIDKIIEIGKLVWDIVKDGKAVVDYKTDWSGAIPEGADWSDLEGFKDMNYGPFGWDFKNVVGVSNVRFKWHFTYSCKGSYDGHGAFLMNVGTAINEIYSAWGYNVNVTATVDDKPTNYGTKIDPIAGLGVEVTINVNSALQSFTERCRVSVHGDCTVEILSCEQ